MTAPTTISILHQSRRVWGLPNLSPFCCKVETYLRMADVPYCVADAVPPLAPKGKLPYITDGEKKVADSRLIIEYLRDRHGVDLDRKLTPSERAESTAFQRLIEDDLHWGAEMWPRWIKSHNWSLNKQAIFGGFHAGPRDIAAWVARRMIRKQIRAQGLGRNTEAEIFQLANRDLTALSDFLADKSFFLGVAPTALDASAFGLLSNVLWDPIQSPSKDHARNLGNLVAFCERIRDRYFEEFRPDGPAGRSGEE